MSTANVFFTPYLHVFTFRAPGRQPANRTQRYITRADSGCPGRNLSRLIVLVSPDGPRAEPSCRQYRQVPTGVERSESISLCATIIAGSGSNVKTPDRFAASHGRLYGSTRRSGPHGF